MPRLLFMEDGSRVWKMPEEGRRPERRLWEMLTARRESRRPSSGGISPVRLLNSRFRISRLVRWESAGGIGPVSLLCDRPLLEI